VVRGGAKGGVGVGGGTRVEKLASNEPTITVVGGGPEKTGKARGTKRHQTVLSGGHWAHILFRQIFEAGRGLEVEVVT